MLIQEQPAHYEILKYFSMHFASTLVVFPNLIVLQTGLLINLWPTDNTHCCSCQLAEIQRLINFTAAHLVDSWPSKRLSQHN